MTIQVNNIFPGELYPSATVGGCIDIFENAWPNVTETVRAIEEQASDPNTQFKWVPATTKGNSAWRTNYNLGVTATAVDHGDPVAKTLHNQMYLLMLSALSSYSIRYQVPPLFSDEGYNLLKYSGGQEYKEHSDGTTASGRCVSAILYLNDNYEGGEIEFVKFGVKIKPKPGTLILFPSNYAYSHIAHPVTLGTKYAIVTWVRDQEV